MAKTQILDKWHLLSLAVLAAAALSSLLGVQVSRAEEAPSFSETSEVSVAQLGGESQYVVSLNAPSVGGVNFDVNSVVQDQQTIANQRQQVIESHDDIIDEASVVSYDNLPAFTATLDSSEVQQIKQDPLVADVQENKVRFAQLDTSVSHINSDDVQTAGFGGEGTAVAILDTGVDRHQFVNVVSDACYSNSGGFGGGTSLCPDGSSSTLDNSGDACDDNNAGCDHGTHVAGIVAGNTARPRVNLVSNLTEVGSGNDFTAEVRLTTGPEAITDFDFAVTYDLTKVSYDSFSESTTDGFTTSITGSPSGGKVTLEGSLDSPPTALSGSDLLIGTITFTADAAASDEAYITVERTSPSPTFTFDDSSTEKPSIGQLEVPIETVNAAGTISTEASAAFTGVAPDAGIIAIQVFTEYDDALCLFFFGYTPCLGATDSDILAGLDRVLELHNDPTFTTTVASVNMSLGGGLFFSQADCDAANSGYLGILGSLRAAGIPTVIATGNNSSSTAVTAPGCISTAVSVGSTVVPSDAVSSFSNGGVMTDILAPGSDILSSTPDGSFSSFSGTSMATPHVAGLWAQFKQINSSFSVDQVLDSLQSEGVDVVDSRNGLTFTRVDSEATFNDIADYINAAVVDKVSDEKGDTATVGFSLLSQPTANVTVPLSIDDTSEASLGGTTSITITPANWNTPSNNQVTITGQDDSVKDGSVSYQLITGDPTSSDSTFGDLGAADVDDVKLTNLDDEIYSLGLLRKQNNTKTSIWSSNGDATEGLTTPVEDANLYWWGHKLVKPGGSGDFNGDGFTDHVLFYKIGTGKTKVYVSLGSAGGLGVPILIQQLDWWLWDSIEPAVAGDVNGDGLDDIRVFFRRGNGSVNVWQFSGHAGSILSGPILTHQLTWWNFDKIIPAASDDFNGDAYEDQLVYHQTGGGGSNAWLITGSASSVGSPIQLSEAMPLVGWTNIKTGNSGDVNGDGYADATIAYNVYSTTNVMVQYGSESGLGPAIPTLSLYWWQHASTMPAGTSDFNGDGYADMALFYKRGDDYLKAYISYGSATGLTAPQLAFQDLTIKWSDLSVLGGY